MSKNLIARFERGDSHALVMPGKTAVVFVVGAVAVDGLFSIPISISIPISVSVDIPVSIGGIFDRPNWKMVPKHGNPRKS